MKKKLFLPFLVWITFIIAMLIFDRVLLLFSLKDSYQLFLQDFFLFLTFYVLNKRFLHITFMKRTSQNFLSVLKINTVPLIFSTILIVDVFVLANTLHSSIMTAFIIALSAAILEEFFFRGLLINMLLKKDFKHKLFVATLLSSLMFGLSHIVNLHFQSLSGTLFQMVNSFALGMMLAAIYLRTGSLLYSTIFHFILDFSTTLIRGIVTVSPNSHTLFSSAIVEFIYILTAIILIKNSKSVKNSVISTNVS